LVNARPRAWREIMVRGQAPDAASLAGWEYRGTNMPATSKLMGLRRFIKGFVADDDHGDHGDHGDRRVLGYNKQVAGADLTTPWTPRPQRDGRVAFAWFTVAPVDPEAFDNRYLNALLLDYGAAPSPEPGIPSRLRDYLVRVVAGQDDLLLGHAFMAFGERRAAVGWFALERLQPANPLPDPNL